jgi:hypothetical protein
MRSAAGDRASRLLAMMDGTRTINEIASELAASEPTARPDAVLDEVKRCVRRYSR